VTTNGLLYPANVVLRGKVDMLHFSFRPTGTRMI
jgi:hypothetical protein